VHDEPNEAEHAMEKVVDLIGMLQFFLGRLEMTNLQIVADCCEFFCLGLNKIPQAGCWYGIV
jgi:hypothetical protein